MLNVQVMSVCPFAHLISSLKLWNKFQWHLFLGDSTESCKKNSILAHIGPIYCLVHMNLKIKLCKFSENITNTKQLICDTKYKSPTAFI
jgi:hypothetical protein